MSQRRDKLVSFRATEDEYEHICEVSTRHGFRSVSEFARDALTSWTRRLKPGYRNIPNAVECLCSRISNLENRLIQIEASRSNTTDQ